MRFSLTLYWLLGGKIQLLRSVKKGLNTAGDEICQLSKKGSEYHESIWLNWSWQLRCPFGEILIYLTQICYILLGYNFARGSFHIFSTLLIYLAQRRKRKHVLWRLHTLTLLFCFCLLEHSDCLDKSRCRIALFSIALLFHYDR